MSQMSDALRPGQDARSRERALEAAREKIRSAGRKALLATCRWIEAEGTVDEVGARRTMDQADRDLNAACELYERVDHGSATGHELLMLLRERRDRREKP
jgi:hypothetical protein